MGLDRSTYGERAWVRAFAELNSSKVKELGAVLNSEPGNIMRLSDYLLSGKNMDFLKNLQNEGLDLDQLDGLYVLTANATRGEYKGSGEIEMIINVGKSELMRSLRGDYYRDIGIISYDQNSKEESFKLDSKIEQDIEVALRGAVDEATKSREFDITSLDQLVERLARDKNLCPQTREEVARRTQEAGGKVDEEKLAGKTEEESQQEKNGEKLIDGLPEGNAIETYLEAKGISKADIKQVTVIKDIDALAASLGDSTTLDLSPGASSVVAVSLKNKEANTKSDRVVTFQGNRVNDDRANDAKINDFKQKHGKDSKVIEKTIPEEDTISYKNDSSKPEKTVLVGADKATVEFIQQKILEIELYQKQQIAELNERDDLTPTEKSAAITEITGNAYAEIVKIESETGVDLSDVSERFYSEAYEAAMEEERVKIEETTRDVIGAVAEGVSLVTAAALGLEENDDDERQHLTPAEEAMRRRGF